MVNVFPKDITLWSEQDSNPGPSAPDPDALTTIPQRPHVSVCFHCSPTFIFRPSVGYVPLNLCFVSRITLFNCVLGHSYVDSQPPVLSNHRRMI